MKHTVTIATILPDVRYTQLALYDLKAYALKYSKFSTKLNIRLYEIEADRHQFLLGTTYPVLNKRSLVRHAVEILKDKPRIVGFSCFMWNMEFTLRLCRIIKSLRPDVVVVLGGPEASSDPKNFLSKNNFADIVVRDEGEATFTEIIDSVLSQENNFSSIKGLSFKENGQIKENEYRAPIDLNTVPSPYLTGLIDLNKNMSFALETSRGCPFHCAYCTYSIRGYHQLRFFPLAKVLAELKLVLSKRPKKIRIMDDNFNINPLRTDKILTEIAKAKHKSDIKIFLNSSMWEVGEHLVKLLKKSDIVCSIGVQSINSRVLKLIRRANKQPVLERNLENFNKYGLQYELSFILGLPGETYGQIKESLNWAFRYYPREINLFPLMVFKGTYLNLHSRSLGLSVHKEPFYIIRKTKSMTQKQIAAGNDLREYIGLLYNKGLLKNTLRFISGETGFSFTRLIEELSAILKGAPQKKTPSGLQKVLIKSMIKRYPQLKPSPILQSHMREDLHFYLRSGQ